MYSVRIEEPIKINVKREKLPLHSLCGTRPNQTCTPKADIYKSLTRCYRPLPCCKVSIQLGPPTF